MSYLKDISDKERKKGQGYYSSALWVGTRDDRIKIKYFGECDQCGKPAVAKVWLYSTEHTMVCEEHLKYYIDMKKVIEDKKKGDVDDG